MPGDHHPKYKSCVTKVKAKGGDDVNPYAVCHASTGEIEEEAYPWGQCQADQKKAGHDKDSANKICGSIKAGNETIEETVMRQVLDASVENCKCQKNKKKPY